MVHWLAGLQAFMAERDPGMTTYSTVSHKTKNWFNWTRISNSRLVTRESWPIKGEKRTSDEMKVTLEEGSTGLTWTGSLSILEANFLANGSLIFSTCSGRNDGNSQTGKTPLVNLIGFLVRRQCRVVEDNGSFPKCGATLTGKADEIVVASISLTRWTKPLPLET